MVDLLTRENADVVALQEVTHPLLVALQNAPGLSSYNIESTLPPPATGWRRYLPKAAVFLLGYQPWGQVILSKWTITEARSYPLYGRPFLVSKITFDDLSVTIGTCHWNSFENENRTRVKQLNEAFKILGSAQHALLLGDFNFGDGEPEHTALPSAYWDVWLTLHPNDPGYTYDTKANTWVVHKVAPGTPSQRIDRILVRSTMLTPQRVVLAGVKPVLYKNKPMHLSDHYGVLASLRLSRNSAGLPSDWP